MTMTAGRTIMLLALGVALTAAACGGGTTLTDYVDRLNAVEAAASSEADELASTPPPEDFTPQLLQRGLERSHDIRVAVQDAADAIDPPDEVAELHERIFAWHEEFMRVESALAERAGLADDTDEGWTALSASPEMAAYRRSLAEGKDICDTFQADLDATAARGAFEDVPWLPGRMSEVVDAAIGCEWFPEDPSTVFLWPPP